MRIPKNNFVVKKKEKLIRNLTLVVITKLVNLSGFDGKGESHIAELLFL